MSHEARCAVYDPMPGACDCQAGQKDVATKWFHHLWTKAGYAQNYDKSAWNSVRDQLVAAGIINS